jgi:hypothetical protein
MDIRSVKPKSEKTKQDIDMNRKTLLLVCSALAALGAVSQVSAQTTNFYITGSTAFRSKTFNAIFGLSGWTGSPTFAGRGGSHANGDNCPYMLWHGTYHGIDTFINCVWSGSEAGVASVAAPGGNPVFFLKTTVTGTNSSAPLSTETNTSPTAPDLCLADTSQAVSLNPTPHLVGMGTLGGGSDPGRIGVVPFTWAKNVQSNPSNFWSEISNITDAQARNLLSGPIVPALMTANPVDTNNFIYCVGRNSFSGTHVNTMLETKIGISFPPQQFSIGGFPKSSTAFVAGDPNALDSTSLTLNGYDSGGDVQKALSIDASCQQADPNFGGTGWMAIGYLGMDDANGITNVNNHTGGPTYFLTLNGNLESDGAVEHGEYNYWGYEHLYGRVNIAGTGAAVLGADLAADPGGIPSQLAGGTPSAHSGGIKLTNMHSSKNSDQADPIHD